MSREELLVVNTALKAFSSQTAAAVLDPVQLAQKIRAYLSAHERRDAEQLRLVHLHERARDSLLLATEGPYYDPAPAVLSLTDCPQSTNGDPLRRHDGTRPRPRQRVELPGVSK